jgi:hypothetical protein
LLIGLDLGVSSSLSESARPLLDFGFAAVAGGVGWAFEEDLILALALVGAAAVAFFRGGMWIPYCNVSESVDSSNLRIYTNLLAPCGAAPSYYIGKGAHLVITDTRE